MENGARRRAGDIVLFLFVLGAAGTLGELLLIGHYEGGWQWAPLALLAASLAAAGWWRCTTGGAGRVVFVAALWLLVAAGAAGLWFHYQANVEFAAEGFPALGGVDLFWNAVRGASPTSLAPGSLIHLGLLGLAGTFIYGGRT